MKAENLDRLRDLLVTINNNKFLKKQKKRAHLVHFFLFKVPRPIRNALIKYQIKKISFPKG